MLSKGRLSEIADMSLDKFIAEQERNNLADVPLRTRTLILGGTVDSDKVLAEWLNCYKAEFCRTTRYKMTPEHKSWLAEVCCQLIKHLNRVELILADNCTYTMDKETSVGINTFMIGQPSGIGDDTFIKGWISYDWAMGNLEADLKRLRQLVHHDKEYSGYRSVVREATAYLVKLKKEMRW